MKITKLPFLFVVLLFLFIGTSVSASATIGIIDTTDKHAWGENTGWINWKTSNDDVQVLDTQLIGHIWSDNFGWINLQPIQSGVTNDAEGNLSGFAWGEGIGYIDFSAVTIDSNGYFHGYATNPIAGQISLNCDNTITGCGLSNYKVRTDWRPASTRSTTSHGGGGNGSSKPFIPSDSNTDVKITDRSQLQADDLEKLFDSIPLSENSCLDIDSLRYKSLIFKDVQDLDENRFHTELLKATIDKQSQTYLISGYNSTKNTAKQYSNIGLDNPLLRLEVAKIIMASHCLPILQAGTSPELNAFIAQYPDKEFTDLPYTKSNDQNIQWQKDIMYSALYHNVLQGFIINGKPEARATRAVTTAQLVKMLIETSERYNKQNLPLFHDKLNTLDTQIAKTNDWFTPFYKKAANLNWFHQSLYQNQNFLNNYNNISTNIIRRKAFISLIKVMIENKLYPNQVNQILDL